MRSIWTGSISFGLINIPVKIFSAVQESSLDLDMLDSKDHSNIKFKRVNENTGKEVAYQDIVKGYKLDRGTIELNAVQHVRNGIINSDNNLLVIDPRLSKRLVNKNLRWLPMRLIMAFVRERANSAIWHRKVSHTIKTVFFMKSFNKASTVIFQKLVSLLGENEHLKLDNAKDSFMYLSFEKLYECDFVGRPATVYSMSHYFEQEGDLVSDPDMTFIAPKDKPESFFPATFQNMLSYTEALYKKDKDVWVINNSKQAFRVG